MPNKREEFIKELYADAYESKQDMYVYDMDKDIDLDNLKFNAEGEIVNTKRFMDSKGIQEDFGEGLMPILKGEEIEIGGTQYANNI